MHSTTTASTNQVRPCSNARRVPLRALLLALIVMTSLQQAALAAPSVPRTKTRTLDPWIECLKRPNGTFQYNPNPNFNVPQGFKDQLIPQFSGTLYACGTPVMSQLYFRMQVNRSGTPDPVPARRTQDGVLVDQLTPGDYVLTVEVFLTRTPEDARALRDATGDKPLPQVPLVPLNRPKIQQPFRITALTPNIVPTTATNVRLSTQQTQSLTISFGANVNNMGPNKANWTCCVTGAPTGPCGGPCPDALRNQVSGTNNANVAIKVSDGKMLNVGLYRLTLTVGPANASFLISVESAAVVPIEVTQDFDQSKDAFMIFARTMQEAQVSWTVAGVDRPPADASGRSLRVPRGNLSTTMPTEVVVKATLKDGTSGTATIQLAPVIAPMVNCQATNAENPGQGNVQALTDLVRLRATVSGVPQDASLSYNFGFGRAPQSSASVGDDAAPVFVTPGPILTNEFNTTAPNVPVASPSNFQVPFFVEVVVNGQIKLRAACPLIVNPPVFGSPAQADALVKQQQQQFARAVDSGDNSAMVNAAANAMGLALAQGTAKTDEASRRQLEKDLAGNMATALRRTFGTENSTGRRTSDMTAEVKGNALDCLSQMSLAPLKPGAPPPADCNASCIAQLRQDVLDVISSAIAPGTDGTRIDMKTNAKKVLDLLSNVAPGRDTNAAVRSAAVALAAQVSVGETVVIASTDGKTKIAGKTIPATLVADLTSTVYEKLDSTTGGVSMSWPSGVMLPGAAAGSTVSLAATTLTTTPFPTTNGLPANVAASSSTTDFSVALDGLEQNVTNLGVPIKAEITRTPFSANAQTMVRYYDESTSSWSSAGITDVTYDPATGRVSFKTTHLTAFATFDTQTAADTPAPPVTTTAAGNATTTAAVAPATTMAIGGDASARTVVALAVCAAFALVVA